ncbi:DUF4091 domain-containing protein [Candidatus Poribacteria bacterium]|nr:DUF4091 domain-containing protein [Candidatus Poribacteria bacterium]
MRQTRREIRHATGCCRGTYSILAAVAAPLHLVLIVAFARIIIQTETLMASPLTASDYGQTLLATSAADVWWADATRKVGKRRDVPTAVAEAATISAARHEYESFQIVIRPKRHLRRLRVTASGLKSSGSAEIASRHVSVARVLYVPVTKPTDNTGSVGAWPDPIASIQEPFDLTAGVNVPIWVTVYIPSDATPGDYSGAISLDAEDWSSEVPYRLHVWDFALPRETHVQTAFGFSPGVVRRYHRLDTDEELRTVVDRYYRSFSAHRISPYDPTSLDPIEVRLDESVTPSQIRVDFTRFDAAASRYFDEFGFNSLRLPLRGVGGGTFHSHHAGEFFGHAQGSPEYNRLFRQYAQQIETHLEEKGWLDKAYIYWFDEPEPKDFDFVKAGMENIRQAAPKLNRMLTEEPSEALHGYVELWCAMTPDFDPELAEPRREKGERFWWYICTAPKAPYVTLFTDHPATELRVWLWQTWKYGVDGILVWQSNYWTSDLAFPDGIQDPYADPMSYQTGYGREPGHVGHWGNGDGRFIYPPPETVGTSPRKSLDGPASSIRWEMLREGIEDYEYLWLLRETVKVIRASLANLSSDANAEIEPHLAQSEDLLMVPDAISKSMTEFATDPAAIYEHRARIAQALERLGAFCGAHELPSPR